MHSEELSFQGESLRFRRLEIYSSSSGSYSAIAAEALYSLSTRLKSILSTEEIIVNFKASGIKDIAEETVIEYCQKVMAAIKADG